MLSTENITKQRLKKEEILHGFTEIKTKTKMPNAQQNFKENVINILRVERRYSDHELIQCYITQKGRHL